MKHNSPLCETNSNNTRLRTYICSLSTREMLPLETGMFPSKMSVGEHKNKGVYLRW